jgi:hypothetical protein
MKHRAALLIIIGLLGLVSVAEGGAAELKRALEQTRAAAQSGDAAALDRGLQAALAEGGKPAVKGLLDLLQAFPPNKEALYWQVVGGLVSVSDRAALDGLGDFLTERGETPLAHDLMLGLQGNRTTEVLELYRRLLRPRAGPLQTSAVDRVGELERPEAVDLLLELWKREEGSGSALARRIRSTMTGLFGEDMGDRLNWEGWWAQHRETAFAPAPAAAPGQGGGTVDLDRAREGGISSMSRNGGRVIVLRGTVRNFDEIEKILERLHVRFEVVLKTDFNKNPVGALDRTAAIVMNCSFFGSLCRCPTCKPGQSPGSRLPVCTGCDVHDTFLDQLDPGAISCITTWVTAGGCVFTEDYGLKELTGKAWKDFVEAGPDMTPEREVDYSPAPGQADTSLLRGVLVQPGAHGGSMTAPRSSRWKIDNLSPSIRVVDPARVQVLLTSQELRGVANGNGAVAVAFSPDTVPPGTTPPPVEEPRRGPRTGGGRRGEATPVRRNGLVVHVLSHFGKQHDEQDEFTLQNLLVNFLLEAQERHRERAAR